MQVTTSTSGWNSLSMPLLRPMLSTYVIKAMEGMYRSGALASATGRVAPLPPLPPRENWLDLKGNKSSWTREGKGVGGGARRV